MPTEQKNRRTSWRLSTLFFLVLFVFFVLLVSILVAGALSFLLVNAGILPPLSEKRFPVVLIFLLLVSLFIGTIIALLGGERFLRPLRDLARASREIAAGNFSVRVQGGGSSEIDRLAQDFNEMAHELASLEQMRNDFISNISHELKTPIVSIRGFARRLRKKQLTEEQRIEYLDIIINETERLTRLAGSIMLLSKLENTARLLERTSYHLDEQIRQVILLLNPQLEKKQLELQIDLVPGQITANAEMIQQVWVNLIENAIKFTSPGGRLVISSSMSEDQVKVFIKDNGIGIDDEMQKHIFEKFYQADSSRLTEGSGLGLPLVKRILQLSGGSIEVSSAPGQGSCFTVLLPVV